MIPPFTVSGNLPAGVHEASWGEVLESLAWTPCRRELLCRALPAFAGFRRAGCTALYLAGSFVSTKSCPGDIDVLWDPTGVSMARLTACEPLLGDFSPPARRAQQARFGAEFIPLTVPRDGLPFLEFFQTDKATDLPRGIVKLDLRQLP